VWVETEVVEGCEAGAGDLGRDVGLDGAAVGIEEEADYDGEEDEEDVLRDVDGGHGEGIVGADAELESSVCCW